MLNIGCGSPCNTRVVIVKIWVTNAPITLLPVVLLGSSLATTSPRVGFVTTLTLLNVSMGTTASVKLFNDFNAFVQTLRLYNRTEFSIGTFHPVPCVQGPPYVCSLQVLHLLSASFFCFLLSLLSQQVMDRLSSSASTASNIDDYGVHKYVESSVGIALRWTSTWPRSFSLVNLLLSYFVTLRLHDDTLGTIAPRASSSYGTIATL